MYTLMGDNDPITGTRAILHHDETGGKVISEVAQDVSDMVDVAKAAYASHDERARFGGEFHHVGFIPMSLYFKLRKQARGDKQRLDQLIKEFMNDRDNRMFRTRPGRV